MTKSLRITGKNSDGDYWLHIHGATQSAGLNLGDPAGLIASALVMAASGQTFIRADAPELVALVEEMKTFCHRVENGEVRSKRSYAAFKAALSAYEGMGK